MKKEHTGALLAGNTCIITGGAGLLGSEFGRALACQGATVLLLDIDAKKAEAVARDIRKETKHEKVYAYHCDITDEKSVSALFAAIVKKHKNIDALVNNAYPRNKSYGRAFEKVTYADFCDNMSMHLGGYFLMAREAAAVMKKQKYGTIVNMASIYGSSAPRFEIYAGTSLTMPVEYAAIKGGVVMLTKYLASYLGKYGIRVNCISPGGVEDRQPASFIKKYNAKVLLGNRMVRTDDISGVLVFLLSDASKYMTGQDIIVDGGWSL